MAVMQDDIEGELNELRQDAESAQQFFFAYLGIHDLTASRPEVLAAVRRNSMFWIATRFSHYATTFFYLGRIFDQRSAHNLNGLLRMVEKNLHELNREALQRRKERFISSEQAADYVSDKHELTAIELQTIRDEVEGWRAIYMPVYKEIRDHLAHNKRGRSDIDNFTSKASVDEMKRMLGFLHSLHEGLFQLWLNGRNPLPLQDIVFETHPLPRPRRQLNVGETAYYDAQDALLMLESGSRARE
jgi:hypothetical protein